MTLSKPRAPNKGFRFSQKIQTLYETPNDWITMYTMEQIKAMSPEELSAANRTMAKKIAFRYFVVKPVLIVAAVVIANKLAEKMAENLPAED